MTTDYAMLPLDFIMKHWQPMDSESEQDFTYGWQEEIARLKDEGQLHSTAEDVMRSGTFNVPLVLGPYGFVWEGQDRIVAAYMKGVLSLPCTFFTLEWTG